MRRRRRRLQVYYREVILRIQAFKMFLVLFCILVAIGGLSLSIRVGLSPLNAIYEAIALLFFASSVPYPEGDLYLEILWVMYPLLGIFVLADGLSSIGQALKFSDSSSEVWNIKTVELMKNHIIIVGIGNVGLKLLKNYVDNSNDDVVAIDKDDQKGRDEEFRMFQMAKEVPLIEGDATHDFILKRAGIDRAKCIVLVIDDDLLNLKIALRAKQLNPSIRVVLRMFDLEFGNQIKDKLGLDSIISTSSISIPYFIKEISGIS